VSLSGCLHITDGGLAALMRHTSDSLNFSDLSGCYQLSGDGLTSLAAACPQLGPENLAYCSLIGQHEDGTVFWSEDFLPFFMNISYALSLREHAKYSSVRRYTSHLQLSAFCHFFVFRFLNCPVFFYVPVFLTIIPHFFSWEEGGFWDIFKGGAEASQRKNMKRGKR
jgi:hypothetical protein